MPFQYLAFCATLQQVPENGCKLKLGAFYVVVCVSRLLEDYMQAVEGIKKNLVKKSSPLGLTFVGELSHGRFSPKMVNGTPVSKGNLTCK